MAIHPKFWQRAREVITGMNTMRIFVAPDNNIIQVIELPAPPPAVLDTPLGRFALFNGITKSGHKFHFYTRADNSLDRMAMIVRLVDAQFIQKQQAQ